MCRGRQSSCSDAHLSSSKIPASIRFAGDLLHIGQMDVSNKDLSRAKYRLSQSRKRAHAKGGPARGSTQKHDSSAKATNTTDTHHGPILPHGNEPVNIGCDRVDLRAMLELAWTTQSTTSQHRHAAMIESLLETGSNDSTLMKHDPAKLDFSLLERQLQSCPEYFLSGLHPSVAAEVPATAVLASSNMLSGQLRTRTESVHAKKTAQVAQQRYSPAGIGLGSPSPTELSNAIDSPSPSKPSHTALVTPEPSQRSEGPQAGSGIAVAPPNEGGMAQLEEDMEDDLNALLSSSQRRGTASASKAVVTQIVVGGQRASAGSHVLTRPRPPGQAMPPMQNSPQQAPVARSAGTATKADIEDWLDL
eukprot:jgi/Ulvmu1/10518/UM064_0056.1